MIRFAVLWVVIVLALCGLFLFKKLHLLDRPWADIAWTRKPVPTLQGVFVYLIFLAVLGIFFHDYFANSVIQGFLIWWSLIVLVELITELDYIWKIHFKIPPVVRFFFHCLSACLTLYFSHINVPELPFFWDLNLPDWLFYFVFVGWSVFVINAVNWIDWIYAQGNGILAIWFFTLFLLIKFVVFESYETFPNYDMLILVQNLSLILGIISLVYTVIEFKPFWLIRDVWTMFLAFWLAYLSLLWGAKIGTIIVTLSLVIFDAIWIILYRIFVLKKNPMKWDYTHLHHRLLWLGWSRGEVRAFVWIFSLLMMVLILLQGTNRMHKLIIFSLMALLFFGINTYLFIYKKLPCWLKKEKIE